MPNIPVEHDPLGHGDDAFLSLIECRELRLDGVICISHGDSCPFRYVAVAEKLTKIT